MYNTQKNSSMNFHTDNFDNKLQIIIDAWNEQADKYNQWDDLGADEMVEFTILFMDKYNKKQGNDESSKN